MTCMRHKSQQATAKNSAMFDNYINQLVTYPYISKNAITLKNNIIHKPAPPVAQKLIRAKNIHTLCE